MCFDDLDLHRVIGRLEARNTASAGIIERIGMRREGHLVENEFVEGKWQSELVYAILQRRMAGGNGDVSAPVADNRGMSLLEGQVAGASRSEVGDLVIDEVDAGRARVKRV